MSAEWLTAIGTIGTFVVIAASAIAALLQIRHMRSGNAISLLTSYNNEFDTQAFQMAFTYVRSQLPERLQHDDVMDELAKAPPFVGEYEAIRTIANFFEDMGAFVLSNLLDSQIVCMLYSENVMSAWTAISPVAALLRHKLNAPSVWENFEYLALLGTQFVERYPNGLYPKDLPRLPVDQRLVERYKQRSERVYVG
ncbi:MAG TPA: DUF4760 domain-containing protein [Candidatus Baltobacteraceae bacterium]|jgi:hypothetical protein|nr:DUF4760 domain-containing protein [Candidatus Baltobacteraceae bacterium]